MIPSLTLLFSLALAGTPAPESLFQQIVPAPIGGKWARTADRTFAVVLIHGFHIQVLDKAVPKAEVRPWQFPDSPLVKQVGRNADVYVFAYGQNVSLDAIVDQSNLGLGIGQLRKLGYKDIVLVGHSAGGLIARHFVEDHPDSGVTKVIQVCAPNGGSPLAVLTGPKSQKVFRDCLSEKGRLECLKVRADKRIPEQVQFVCVVAKVTGIATTDGVVPCHCQWTEDLQRQGIPATLLHASHRMVVREPRTAESIASLIFEKQDRWAPERIEKAKKEIIGK